MIITIYYSNVHITSFHVTKELQKTLRNPKTKKEKEELLFHKIFILRG